MDRTYFSILIQLEVGKVAKVKFANIQVKSNFFGVVILALFWPVQKLEKMSGMGDNFSNLEMSRDSAKVVSQHTRCWAHGCPGARLQFPASIDAEQSRMWRAATMA